MKKRMLLPLIFLLTFTLGLTSTPAADEWVLHKTITRPASKVTPVHFSVSGSQLIVGTGYNDTDYNVQVYDGNTFEYLRGKDYTDSGQRDGILAIASRKGWYEAAIAGMFKRVYLYNTKGNTTLKTFNTSSAVVDLAYRPDGDRLAAAGNNGDIYIFWTDHQNGTRRLLRTLREHNGYVSAVAWSPNGNILASCGRDGTVRLWNPNSGINYAVLRGHTERVESVAFSPDGKTLASGGQDRTIRIWDVNTRRHLRTIDFTDLAVAIDNLEFHPSKQMLVGNLLGTTLGLLVCNPATGQRIQIIRRGGYGFDLHPNGQFLVKSPNTSDGEFEIWKLVTANPLDVNKDGQVNINDLIEVAKNYGKTGTNNADVNGDNRVDVKDFTAVAKAVNPNFAAPILTQEVTTLPFTAKEIQQWIQEAKKQGVDAEGIAALEQLLAVILHQANPPKETALLANYPNPFNPETWIPYQLAKPAEVTVSIHAANGTLVRKLALGQLPAGVYQDKDRAAYWDGTNEQGEVVASGVYFYTLKAGDFSATKKMLIRK